MTTAHDVLGSFRALPMAGLDEILGGGTPVILAPHQDDEVIGCGALIAAAVRARRPPIIVFVTDGSGSHPNSRAYPRDLLVALRQHEACTAAEILGVSLTRVHFMGIRDTAAPHGGFAFAEAVETIIDAIGPCARPVLFAPWSHDPHGDHQAVAKMASRVAQIIAARHLSYIVWGWTLPDHQVLDCADVRGWRFSVRADKQRKTRALHAYRSQISDLIDDDPTGFRLDAEMLRTMLSDDEVFLLNP